MQTQHNQAVRIGELQRQVSDLQREVLHLRHEEKIQELRAEHEGTRASLRVIETVLNQLPAPPLRINSLSPAFFSRQRVPKNPLSPLFT